MELTKRVLNVQKPAELNGVIVEAWAQGFMVGTCDYEQDVQASRRSSDNNGLPGCPYVEP